MRDIETERVFYIMDNSQHLLIPDIFYLITSFSKCKKHLTKKANFRRKLVMEKKLILFYDSGQKFNLKAIKYYILNVSKLFLTRDQFYQIPPFSIYISSFCHKFVIAKYTDDFVYLINNLI